LLQNKYFEYTYSKQASIEKWLAPYEVMDYLKLATVLDPCFKWD